jgi:hypothetical protein
MNNTQENAFATIADICTFTLDFVVAIFVYAPMLLAIQKAKSTVVELKGSV